MITRLVDHLLAKSETVKSMQSDLEATKREFSEVLLRIELLCDAIARDVDERRKLDR